MSHNPKYIGWFSCGVTSAVACKIAIESGKDVDLWYIETGAEHTDNNRFIADCEWWYGRRISFVAVNIPSTSLELTFGNGV